MEMEYSITNWSDSAEPSQSGTEEESPLVVTTTIAQPTVEKLTYKSGKGGDMMKDEDPLWNVTTLQMVLFWTIFQVLVLVWTLFLGYRTFVMEPQTAKENHFTFVVPEFFARIGMPDTLTMF